MVSRNLCPKESMVAFPENPDGKEEGHPAGTKPQGEKLGKEIMVKGPLERLMVEERAMYPALVILPDGRREILGFWLFGAEGESAENWEEVLKDPRQRGVEKVRIFVSDDLPGLEEAINMPCRTA
ncbi:transposase [Candidatus Bipolaricaulota bacterium]|nr:transposase [Candidatus Bipolaricaulota bacterium]